MLTLLSWRVHLEVPSQFSSAFLDSSNDQVFTRFHGNFDSSGFSLDFLILAWHWIGSSQGANHYVLDIEKLHFSNLHVSVVQAASS